MNLICSIESCGHLAERSGLCATHSREARKKAAPKTKARKTRIAKVSEEQKDRLAAYYPIRDLFLKENPYCLAHSVCFPARSSKELATDIHHKKGREGDLLYDVRFWIPVCRACHSVITIESEWAYNEGLSLSRHQIETI